MLTTIAILLGGLAAVAQHYVSKGTTLSFKADENPNVKYNWSVTHTGTNTVSYLASETHQSGEFTFDAEGTYEVKVYPEGIGTNCFGEPLIMLVVVSGAAPTAVFDDLEAPSVCAQNNGGDANGKLSITVRYSGPKPWTFKYSLDRAPAELPPGADEIYTNSFTFDLEIPNVSGKTRRAEILLVEAKTLSGIPVEEDLANQTLEVDVTALPNTEFGDYDPVVQAGRVQTFTATIEKNENYEIFVPAGAAVIKQSARKLEDRFHSELTFDVQWGNTPGDYQVKLIERSAFGCAGDTIYANVSIVESFVVSLGNDIQICEGESATLQPTIDFDGTYTYVWFDGSEDETLSVTESGTYSVTATDTETGKSSSASVVVSVVSLPLVDLGEDYELAEGEDRILDAGNPGLVYLWSTRETTQQITVNTSAIYSVQVTNPEGCVGSDEVVITSVNDVFAIELGDDKNICDGEEIVLNPNPTIAQNYTYLWSNDANTQTLTVTESGTYSVTLKDDAGNEKSDEIQVTVHPLPIVDLGDDITLYGGESAILTVGDLGAGAVYEWSTGESTQSITVTEENVYSLKVTTADLCSNTDDISVLQRQFTVSLGEDPDPICMGKSISLTPIIKGNISSNAIYKWTTPLGDESKESPEPIQANLGGEYCISVTDNGITENDCVTITVNPTPIVDLGEDIVFSAGQSIELDASANIEENEGDMYYRWNVDPGSVQVKPNATSPTILIEEVGKYSVEVRNSKDCVGRDTVVVSTGSQFFVDFPSAFSPNGDGKNDVLQLIGDIDEIDPSETSLIIYNRLGHKVFQANQNVPWDGRFKGKKLDMDVYVYFIDVTFKDGSSLKKQGNITLLH